MSNILELQAITKSFPQPGAALEVLKGVNLTIASGELVALLGASGSGKTTLLQIAGLLAAPTAGSLKLQGQEVAQASEKQRTLWRRQSIGFVFQFHHLLPEFTALENVILPQVAAGKSRKDAEAHARQLLGELGLEARLSHLPSELSGGEQQRVSIARALANDPALILADEPTGNLDSDSAEKVFQLFLKITAERKVAALVVTHNTELAARMHRMLKLADGQIVS